MIWWILAAVVYVLGIGVTYEAMYSGEKNEFEMAVWTLLWPLWLVIAGVLVLVSPLAQLLAWPGRKLAQVLGGEKQGDK